VLLTECLLAFVIPYVVATAGFAVVGESGARGRLWFCLLCAAMAFSPWMIPVDYRLLRFLAAMSVALLSAKLYDLRFDLLQGTALQFHDYLRFLANPFIVVRRRLAFEPRPARASDGRQLVAGLCGLAAGVTAGTEVFLTDWSKVPFLVEHSAKLIALLPPSRHRRGRHDADAAQGMASHHLGPGYRAFRAPFLDPLLREHAGRGAVLLAAVRRLVVDRVESFRDPVGP
jgi:hypothetical protein